MPEAIRILVVDDEPMVIEGIRSIISRSESMLFVGAVASPDELFAALGATHCDVIIMDYLISDDDCGNPDGLYLLRQIRVSHPAVRTILYTSLERPGLPETALNMGADAILCKRDSVDVLTKTIQVLGSGGMRVAPACSMAAHRHGDVPPALETVSSAQSVAASSDAWRGRVQTAALMPAASVGMGPAVDVAPALVDDAPVRDARTGTTRGDDGWRRADRVGPAITDSGGAGRTLPQKRFRSAFASCEATEDAGVHFSNRVTGSTLPLRGWGRDAVMSSSVDVSVPCAGAAGSAWRDNPSGARRPAPGAVAAGDASPALPYDTLIRFPDPIVNAASLGTRGVWQETRLSLTRLSPRETEIVRLLSNGRSLKEVAAYLGRSPKTISNQKRSAMLKLGLHSDIDLLRFAIDAGLT